jgi:UDP-glucuronate 4-epimerase
MRAPLFQKMIKSRYGFFLFGIGLTLILIDYYMLSKMNSSEDLMPNIARSVSTVDMSELSLDSSDEDSECDVSEVQAHIGYKKVLVTGGAGFIGSNVAEYLLKRGDDVVIVDEVNDYYDVNIKENNLKLLRDMVVGQEQRLSIYKGDICDEAFMLNVFENERPQWVCHMAARAGVRPSIQDPFVYIHSNIRGTTLLLELSHKFKVKNFVFASSSSVYGGSESTYFSESENVDNPVSPYAASKKACELLSYTYHHLYNLNVSALRFFTVYGPRGRPDMAPFKFIDRVSRGLELQQFGDGSSSRDYTYISDIVDGIVRAVDRPHPYEVFNLGKGNGTSLKDFIGLVQKHVGKKANIRVMPDQPGDVPYTCADVTKARKLLGYKAQVSFEEGIKRTATWYKSAYDNPLFDETEISAKTLVQVPENRFFFTNKT